MPPIATDSFTYKSTEYAAEVTNITPNPGLVVINFNVKRQGPSSLHDGTLRLFVNGDKETFVKPDQQGAKQYKTKEIVFKSIWTSERVVITEPLYAGDKVRLQIGVSGTDKQIDLELTAPDALPSPPADRDQSFGGSEPSMDNISIQCDLDRDGETVPPNTEIAVQADVINSNTTSAEVRVTYTNAGATATETLTIPADGSGSATFQDVLTEQQTYEPQVGVELL